MCSFPRFRLDRPCCSTIWAAQCICYCLNVSSSLSPPLPLSLSQEASLFQLSSLQSQLSESVPTSLLDKANREHNDLLVKYQDLLQKQTSYTSTTTTIKHLQVPPTHIHKERDTCICEECIYAHTQDMAIVKQVLYCVPPTDFRVK